MEPFDIIIWDYRKCKISLSLFPIMLNRLVKCGVAHFWKYMIPIKLISFSARKQEANSY